MADANDRALRFFAANEGANDHGYAVVGIEPGWRAACRCGWTGEVLTLKYAHASGRAHVKSMRAGDVATGPAS